MNTTILVHGLADNAQRMAYMARFLRRRGWRVLTPTLRPSTGDERLEELAAQLATFIRNHTLADERVNLVGYSMGGLVCRYYLQRLGGLLKTNRFISISTPHHGTITAYLLKKPGILQMRPRSIFLRELEKDENQLKQIFCTVFYTPMDISILPARSSIVNFANTVRFLVPIHFLMVYYRPLLKEIDCILSTPLNN